MTLFNRTHRCLALGSYSNGTALCDAKYDPRCESCDRSPMMELAVPVTVNMDGKRVDINTATKQKARKTAAALSAARKPERIAPMTKTQKPDVAEREVRDTPKKESAMPEAPATCQKPAHGARPTDGNGECMLCRKYRKKTEKARAQRRLAEGLTGARPPHPGGRRVQDCGNKPPQPVVVEHGVVIPNGALDTIRERLRDYDTFLRVSKAHHDVIGQDAMDAVKSALATEIGTVLIEARDSVIGGAA